MPMETALVRVALPTGAEATVDFTVAGFGTPQAATFRVTAATVDDTEAPDHRLCYGMTDGTNQQCVGGDSTDGADPTITRRFTYTDRCIHQITATVPTAVGAASFNSWITDGVRLNIDTTFTGACLVTALLIKGTNNIVVGNFTSGTAIDQVSDITSPGFTPKGLILASCYNRTTDGWNSDFHAGFGFVSQNAGVVKQAAFGRRDANNQASVIAHSRITASYGIIDHTSSIALELEFGDFDANGFSATVRNQVALASRIMYLAFDCDEEVWAGSVTVPANTGNKTYTAWGFDPQLLLTCCTGITSFDSSQSSGIAASCVGFGAANTAASFASGLRNRDAAAASFCSAISVSGAVADLLLNTSDSILYRADPTADLNTWNYTDTTLAANNMRVLVLAVAAPTPTSSSSLARRQENTRFNRGPQHPWNRR